MTLVHDVYGLENPCSNQEFLEFWHADGIKPQMQKMKRIAPASLPRPFTLTHLLIENYKARGLQIPTCKPLDHVPGGLGDPYVFKAKLGANHRFLAFLSTTKHIHGVLTGELYNDLGC